ncbi:MAG: AgmX/PglI C-terminal domain-containing protein [Nitrospirota bacterium]
MEFQDSDQNFKRIAWICILLYGAVALVINLVSVKTPERQDYTQLSPRIAKLIIEASKPLPPLVTQAKKEEPKVGEKAKEEEKEELKPESSKEKAQEVAKQEGPSPEEVRAQQEAQRKKNMEVAMNSGLLKLLKQSEHKSEAESVPDQKLKKVFSEIKGLSQAPKAASGAALQTSPSASGGIDDIVAQLEKSIQKSKSSGGGSVMAGSGGINPMIGDFPKDVGRSPLAARKTTAVESPFQIKGFEDGKSPRTYESVAQVVDSYKGGISFLYNKALRENPTLRGTVTVDFVITAAGDVIDGRVVESSMNHPPFEEALLKRVLQWKFPPVPAGDVTITYPIVFSIAG